MTMLNIAPIYINDADGTRQNLVEVANAALLEFSKQGNDLPHRIARNCHVESAGTVLEPGNPLVALVIEWAGSPSQTRCPIAFLVPGMVRREVIVAEIVASCLCLSADYFQAASEGREFDEPEEDDRSDTPSTGETIH
ncbi:hypothetical protein [Marivivens marinus]|uniref:hypothetical protein n=1 Tax=Marivivens marinus TaxID=3110173 RepID=UPI003B84A193